MIPKKINIETTKYKSSVIEVRSAEIVFPMEKVATWEYAISADGVAALPIDSNNNVYLIREWRVAWKREVMGIPSGKCKAKTEKERRRVIHKELREEIGMDTKKLEKLTSFYASSRIHLEPHVYLARDLFPSKKQGDKQEFIDIVVMPFKKAFDLFVSGREPTTSYTLISFLLVEKILYR